MNSLIMSAEQPGYWICMLAPVPDVPAWAWPLWELVGWHLYDGGGWGRRRQQWGRGPHLRLPEPQPFRPGCHRRLARPRGGPGGTGHHQDGLAPVPRSLPSSSLGKAWLGTARTSPEDRRQQQHQHHPAQALRATGRGRCRGQWQRLWGQSVSFHPDPDPVCQQSPSSLTKQTSLRLDFPIS